MMLYTRRQQHFMVSYAADAGIHKVVLETDASNLKTAL
jgi:hypothetical protein